MDKNDILNIFDNNIPWIVRYGPIISLLCILMVVFLVFSLGKEDFLITILDYFKTTDI